MSTAPKDFSVAIVGGGLCGLACAVGLVRAGIEVAVFESAPKFDEIGAGVGLGPNALRALEGLGLLDAVLKKADQPKPSQRLFKFVSGTGNHDEIFDYIESCAEHGNEGLGIYRPAFLDAMAPMLDPSVTHFNKRCIAVERGISDRPLIRFSDGTTHEADLVIGADGIKSTTRNAVIGGGENRLGWSGTYAYRGLVPIETLKAAGMQAEVESRPYNWVGLDKHIITFPIKNDTVLNIVAFRSKDNSAALFPERPHPWVEATPEAELLESFQGWGTDALTMLKHMKNPSRWSIHTLYPPLTTYVNGRVVLVGDSAHGMLPHLGAGAGQGLEDVYTLCRLLAHPETKKTNLDAALAIYNELRPARANMVLKRSMRMGKISESYGQNKYDIQDMQQHIKGMWEPVWYHDLEAQVTTALKGFGKVKSKY
ncbi:hypothetical protein GALMADRAFT_373240 [Galerina marginata CBS 339.88]|uniref:FAD-binding domain-containing protein n=1 Tax=Galerina marginata (strain CBS 339.88) TaxID=685588 RepID=A0A067U004_GALM3|nr:hypothetical protein GALMADRAFT_373240 [Galerina marginata CBS 339.88]